MGIEKERKRQINMKFWVIQTVEESEYIIKQVSYVFIVMGAIMLLLGIFLSPSSLVDSAIYSTLGILMLFLKSRIVSILMLVVSILTVLVTVLARLGIIEGGNNVILSIIILYYATSGVYAAFKYRKLKGQNVSVAEQNIPNVQ